MAKPSDVLKSLEKMAKKEFVPSIGPVKGRIITEIIRKYNPKNILEVGTLYGYSAILMAAAASDILHEDRKVVTIEIDRSIADIARKNVAAAAGLSEKINVIFGDALEVIPKLDWKFDLLFLDAAKSEYLTYLKLAEDKALKRGAVIVADNVEVSKNEMLDYLKYVRSSGGIYKSETIETTLEFTPNVRDAIEVSIKVT
jgi:predicted O-methyltransferase YrrM